MQKWGVREHLDEGKGLLSAIIESEEYKEYISTAGWDAGNRHEPASPVRGQAIGREILGRR